MNTVIRFGSRKPEVDMLQSGEIVSSEIRFEAITVAQCRGAQNTSLFIFLFGKQFHYQSIIKCSSLIGCLTVIALRGPLRLVLKINLFGSALQVSVEGNVAATYNYGLLLRHPTLLLSLAFFSFFFGLWLF